MARGDAKTISQNVTINVGEGDYNLSTDTFNYVLVTNTYASIDENAATLTLADLTQVPAGGSYTGPTALTNVTFTRSGANAPFSYDAISIAANAANPTTARCLVVYNDTSASDDVFRVTDLTTDGTTAPSLVQGLTVTPNAAGAFRYVANA